MDYLTSVFGFILAVGVLVTVHEFGHFWVARTLGVKVLKFSIGFGRSLWSWQGKKDDTEYVVALIPLGGFVKMLDEGEGDVDESERHRAFNRQSLATRTAVVVAGPLFNFLFAIAAYWLVFGIGVDGIKPVVGGVAENSIAARAGFQENDRILNIDGRPAQTWGEHRLYTLDKLLDGDVVTYDVERLDGGRRTLELSLGEERNQALSPSGLEQVLGLGPKLPELQAVLGAINEGQPAAIAGFRVGDRITSVDGNPVESWHDLVLQITARPGQEVMVELVRDGTSQSLTLVPATVQTEGGEIGRIGVLPQVGPPGPEYLGRVELGVVQQFTRAVENTWLMSALTLKMLYRMLKLEVSTENLSGPITIAKYAGQTVRIGVVPFLMFLAVISVSLGVLNLLPIPVLDGGHLLYYLIELIRGDPVSERVMYWGQQIGLVMIAGLMGLAFYNDIVRLFQ